MTQILCRVTRVNLQTINPTESIKLFIQILKILAHKFKSMEQLHKFNDWAPKIMTFLIFFLSYEFFSVDQNLTLLHKTNALCVFFHSERTLYIFLLDIKST